MLIDIVFVLLMVMAVIKGFSKGFIVAVFSLVAFVVGLAAALKLSAVVAVYLKKNMHIDSWLLPVLSFAIVFVGVVFLIRIGAAVIKKMAGLVLLGWLDKIFGILLFVISYLMIYSVVLFYATQINLVSSATANESYTYSFVQPWGPWVINGIGKIIPIFSNMFADLKAFFGSVVDK